MDKLFDTILELSWQAGLIALAVMAVRLALRRRVSRRAVCWLWALVALRLLLPLSLTVESPVSLQAEQSPFTEAYHAAQESRPAAVPSPAPGTAGPGTDAVSDAGTDAGAAVELSRWLPWVWAIGMGCMAAYMLLSFAWMRLKLLHTERIEGNAYRCTAWSTPFVLGVLSPRIYVPESVSEENLPQVLAHERCHIRRGDHAETLYALRTEYIGDNSAVSGILDALGFREAGAAGEGEAYTCSFELEMASEPYGVVVRYAFTGALPQRTAEWNRQMARRGYLALALIDNAEWLRWEDVGAEGETPVSGTVYAGDYVFDDYNAVRGSAAGLQALMDVLQARLEDGSIVYYPGDALPDFTEITPWPMLDETGVVSAKAGDYGIVYDAAQLPDWETVPLSYLCAYYLNGDGAYAEGAMDTLAKRYRQAPHTVRDYLTRLRAVDANAAARLEEEVTAWCAEMETGGTTVAGSQVTQVIQGLSVQISGIYSRADESAAYDESVTGIVSVYTIYPGAELTVLAAPTYEDSEGNTHGEYKLYMKNGDVIELFPHAGPFALGDALGIGAESAYLIRFEAYDQHYLSYNRDSEGLVDVPATQFTGSGYSIYILDEGWHRLTLVGGWNDATVDGSPALNGKPVEVWESTEDITARLYVAHLGAMTLKEAQDWADGAAGSSFTLTESRQGDMVGMDSTGNQYWLGAFPGSDTARFAVVKTVPVAQWEHLGYALSAMADTFTIG